MVSRTPQNMEAAAKLRPSNGSLLVSKGAQSSSISRQPKREPSTPKQAQDVAEIKDYVGFLIDLSTPIEPVLSNVS